MVLAVPKEPYVDDGGQTIIDVLVTVGDIGAVRRLDQYAVVEIG
jgi:hypothetical protein